jgi:DNA repair and recombination protein RAD52
MFTPEQIKALEAKLSPDAVKARKQGGASVSYIEGWHAIAEANRIFGFDAWSRETIEVRFVSEKERKMGANKDRDGWSVSYIARVRIIVSAGDSFANVIREGVGAGHGIDADLGQAHESAIKEAETDAMKRALMTFGNPFGLALYDKERTNVGYEEPEIDDVTLEGYKIAVEACVNIDDLKGIWKQIEANGHVTDATKELVSKKKKELT